LYGIVKFPLWPAKLAITLGTALLSLRLITDIVRNPIWFTRSEISPRRRYLNIAIVLLVLILLVGITLIVKNLELSSISVGWSVLGLFIILLFIGLPVAPSMAIIGILGIWIMSGSAPAFNVAGTIPFSASAEYTMTVMPLFIVMGTFAGLAGFAESGFELAKNWLVGIKGGIVHATIVGSTIFAAATGSGAASCVVLTRLTLPEMLKSGVRKGMAIGVIASASTLAIMIPPSTSFVIYAMMTGNSTGKLLIAGIIPGLIGAAMIMLTVFLRCQFDPSQVQPLSAYRISWKERFTAIPKAWGIALVVLVIVGGIFTGVFTPTEAGAVGAFVTFISVVALRKGNARSIFRVLLDSAGITSVILFILVGGMLFGNMISITRLPPMLSSWVVGLSVPPLVILIIIMVFYFVVGCFMDSLSIMIITLPIIYPVIVGLGFDPIWFGVLQVQNLEISVITPPYGMNLFILKGLLPETSMTQIFRGVLWFIIPLILTMAIYIAFPQTALWLPNMMVK
jgi:C4-dicarboxylate transporter, DctM subunit